MFIKCRWCYYSTAVFKKIEKYNGVEKQYRDIWKLKFLFLTEYLEKSDNSDSLGGGGTGGRGGEVFLIEWSMSYIILEIFLNVKPQMTYI